MYLGPHLRCVLDLHHSFIIFAAFFAGSKVGEYFVHFAFACCWAVHAAGPSQGIDFSPPA